jgi:hypothetical protein
MPSALILADQASIIQDLLRMQPPTAEDAP